MIDDIILAVLLLWLVPLVRFVFFALTDAVPGTRFRRRLVALRSLAPITRMLLAQKTTIILVVLFIGVVRFTGGFPGREWVALGLYTLLVAVAFAVDIYQRRLQLPRERRLRGK